MQAQNYRRYKPSCGTIASKTQDTAQDTGVSDPNNNSELLAMHRHPTQLPNPWLFDSEKLIRELDRCREQVLLIPCNGDLHATHFAINIAVNAIWNLSEQLRYLLHLHRDGQRQFAKKSRKPYGLPNDAQSTIGNNPRPDLHKTPGAPSQQRPRVAL